VHIAGSKKFIPTPEKLYDTGDWVLEHPEPGLNPLAFSAEVVPEIPILALYMLVAVIG